jgi:hypothetical protein
LDEVFKKEPMNEPTSIFVEVSAGELWDKITILRIKSERISNEGKVDRVRAELAMLDAAAAGTVRHEGLESLVAQLADVNSALWNIENEIRACEHRQDFGPRFVALARSVYRRNDERGRLKLLINELCGAKFVEQKEYNAYS